jgi:hypothetical protein
MTAALWLAAALVKGVIRPAFGLDAPEWLRLALGSAPSLLGGLSVPPALLAFHSRPGVRDIRRVCLWGLAIALVAELIELRLQGSTFDWLDLTAAVLGVVVAAAACWAVLREGGAAGTSRRGPWQPVV